MSAVRPYPLNVKVLRRLLLAADDVIHFAVAAVLVASAATVLVRTLPNLLRPGMDAILHLLNDVLFVLIVMELLWPVVRFLKREPFSLSPFLYVGIMSSTRRLLLIEAEHSMVNRMAEGRGAQPNWYVLAELGVHVGIILALALALRLLAPTEHSGRPSH